MSTTQQPEALRLAELCDNFQILEKIGTELRRQHARIAELEAQLAATHATQQGLELANCKGGKWLTVVYHDIQPGDESRTIGEHPKVSALSWSHALHDRDTAIAAQAKKGGAAMTHHTDAERAKFEAVASDCGEYPRAIERDAKGNYLLQTTAHGWMWWQAARRAPAEPVISEAQVLAITTAYEQGVGKGHQSHARKEAITNPYGDEWGCDSAWQMGYGEGREQAERKAAAPAAPQGWKPVQIELLERIQESLGSYLSDHGWSQSDMDTADALDGFLAAAPQPPEAAQASVSNGTLAAHVMLPCVERIDVLEVAKELKENISAFGDTKGKAKERAAFYLVSQHEQLLYWQQQVRQLRAIAAQAKQGGAA